MSKPGCWTCRYCGQAFGGPVSRQEHEIEHQKMRPRNPRDEHFEWFAPIYVYAAEGHSIERTAAVFGCSVATVHYALALHGLKI